MPRTFSGFFEDRMVLASRIVQSAVVLLSAGLYTMPRTFSGFFEDRMFWPYALFRVLRYL